MTADGGARTALNGPGTEHSVTRAVAVPEALLGLVADRTISINAACLYMALLAHYDKSNIRPTRAAMARYMGMNRPQSVDKYLAELRTAGLTFTDRPGGAP
jgi:hypothetical protein